MTDTSDLFTDLSDPPKKETAITPARDHPLAAVGRDSMLAAQQIASELAAPRDTRYQKLTDEYIARMRAIAYLIAEAQERPGSEKADKEIAYLRRKADAIKHAYDIAVAALRSQDHDEATRRTAILTHANATRQLVVEIANAQRQIAEHRRDACRAEADAAVTAATLQDRIEAERAELRAEVATHGLQSMPERLEAARSEHVATAEHHRTVAAGHAHDRRRFKKEESPLIAEAKKAAASGDFTNKYAALYEATRLGMIAEGVDRDRADRLATDSLAVLVTSPVTDEQAEAARERIDDLRAAIRRESWRS